MKAPRPLNTVFFRTPAGNEPVREWIKSLSRDDMKDIGTDIQTVEWAWPVGPPLVENLGDGVWEIRSHLKKRKREYEKHHESKKSKTIKKSKPRN